MTQTISVIGYGPVGQETARQLLHKGYGVRVIQRHAPPTLPEGATFAAADATQAADLARVIAGSATVVCALGLPYDGKIWVEVWPRLMAALLSACEGQGARLVFVDNLYLYGPQDVPLVETMPPVDYGVKPAVRSAVTRLWQQAAEEGRVQTAAVRAPDFFGPGVTQSILGTPTIGRLAEGKPAQLLVSADFPHDVVHVADFARAVVTLVEAPDDAYGQAWHVPTPPTKTYREILAIAAAAMDVPLRLSVIPGWAARALGLVMPPVREVMDLHFTIDRPYYVDSSKFRARFWSDVDPLEDSVAATARSYRAGSR